MIYIDVMMIYMSLIPGKNLCPRCYIQVMNIQYLEPQSSLYKENVQPDCFNEGDVIPFSVERAITPRNALSSASIITPVCDPNKSNKELPHSSIKKRRS